MPTIFCLKKLKSLPVRQIKVNRSKSILSSNHFFFNVHLTVSSPWFQFAVDHFRFFFGRLAGRSIRIAAAAVGVGAGGVGGGGGGGGGGGHGAPQASDVGERRRIVGRQTQRLAVVELGLGELAVDVQHGAQIAVRRRVLFRSFFLQKKKKANVMVVGWLCRLVLYVGSVMFFF